MTLVDEPQGLRRTAVWHAQEQARVFVVSLQRPVDEGCTRVSAWNERMPVAHEKCIKVPANLTFTSPDFDCPTSNRTECSNDAIASFDTESVAVREKETVSKDGEMRICLSWNEELHPRIANEVAF